MKWFLGLFLYLFLLVPTVNAQNPPTQTYLKARVENVNFETKIIDGNKTNQQIINLTLLEGINSGKQIQINNLDEQNSTAGLKVTPGEILVLTQIDSNPTQYYITDRYRLDKLPIMLVFLLIGIIVVAGWKGIGSVLGLGISFSIIIFGIIPAILAGFNTILVVIIGSILILVSTTYIAHGISKQTTIALLSTFFALVVTAILSYIIVNLTRLSGLGGEDAYSLRFDTQTARIDFAGLFLGGIIIGTLGALNDITTTQAATIFELHQVNPKLTFYQLFTKSMSIGREHIVSLINTLVLSFAGSGTAILIFFVINPLKTPTWVILNSELIYEEIVRAICSSFGLLSSVPFVSVLAAYFVTKVKKV